MARTGRISNSNMRGFPYNDFNLRILDSFTVDYGRRVINNRGIIDNNDLNAINNFVLYCKRHLIWHKLFEIGVFAGNNLNACLVKLKFLPGVQSVLTNFDFIEADYNKLKGLKGNGTNKYLKTGFIPAIHLSSSFNCHVSIYSRTLPAAALNNPTYIGCLQTPRFFIRKTSSSNKIDSYIGNSTENNASMALDVGLITASNISVNNGSIYLNSILKNSDTTFTTESKVNQEVYIFALKNSSGNAANYIDTEICFYSLGLGLTTAEVELLSIAVSEININLKRQI